MQSGTLLMVATAVLLVGIFGITWTVVKGLHARIDRLSDHVTEQLVRSVSNGQIGREVWRPFATSGRLCAR